MTTQSFSARWSDGRTASTYPATVTLGRAVEIMPQGASQPVLWSLHRTLASAPLWRSSKDVLLRSLDHPGQTIFVDHADFAPALLRLAPHLGAGSKRLRDLRPGLGLLAVVLAIGGSIYALDLSPAKYVAGLIPDAARIGAGQQVLSELDQLFGSGRCEAPEGYAALQNLALKLKSAGAAETDFSLAVVDWSFANAFALPGNQLIVTSALIKEANAAEEVAGVLAHEMGHAIELHPEAGLVRRIGMQAASEIIFTGSSGTLGTAGETLVEFSFTRSAEREADEHALRILKEAKISPLPIAEFFDRLAKEFGETEDEAGVSKYFSTHPPSPERAALAKAAATYETEPAMSPEEWASLKAICAQQPVVEDAPPVEEAPTAVEELPPADSSTPPPDPSGQPPLPPT